MAGSACPSSFPGCPSGSALRIIVLVPVDSSAPIRSCPAAAALGCPRARGRGCITWTAVEIALLALARAHITFNGLVGFLDLLQHHAEVVTAPALPLRFFRVKRLHPDRVESSAGPRPVCGKRFPRAGARLPDIPRPASGRRIKSDGPVASERLCSQMPRRGPGRLFSPRGGSDLTSASSIRTTSFQSFAPLVNAALRPDRTQVARASAAALR